MRKKISHLNKYIKKKFQNLSAIFTSWIRIRILNADPNPDPATQINANPCGPDPKPWVHDPTMPKINKK
jgi:hypothetical protein